MALTYLGADFDQAGDSVSRSLARNFVTGEQIIAIADVSNLQVHGTIQGTGWTQVLTTERTGGPTLDVWTKKASGDTSVTVTFPASNNALHVYYDTDTSLIYNLDEIATALASNATSLPVGPTPALGNVNHKSLAAIVTRGNAASPFAFTNSFTENTDLAGQLGHRLGTAWKTHTGTAAQSTTASWSGSLNCVGGIVSFNIVTAQQVREFLVNALLRGTYQETFDINALLSSASGRSFDIDAILQSSSVFRTFAIDAELTGTNPVSYLVDALLFQLQDVEVHTLAARLGYDFGRVILGDEMVGKFSPEPSPQPAGAVIEGSSSFSLDALIQSGKQRSFSVSAVLSTGLAKLFGIDARLIAKDKQRVFSINASLASPAVTSSLFWSAAEVSTARQRAAGPSNFEWDEIKADANLFFGNPNGLQLAGFNPMACGGGGAAPAQRQAIDDADFANRVAAAATVEMATARTDRLDTIGSALVIQMMKPNFDFYNTTKYPLNCTDNQAPGHHLSMYLGKLIYAIDTIEALGYQFTPADRSEMAARFHGWARVGCNDATTKMLQFYSSPSATKRQNREIPTLVGPGFDVVRHYDGAVPAISDIGLALNNRRAKPVLFAAMSQAWTKNLQWDSHIRLWAQDMFDYGYSPEYNSQPAMVDMYRGWQQAPEAWKGAHYGSTTVAGLGLIAEMYRRGFGDSWLWNYRSSRGVLESTKSRQYGLLEAIEHFVSYCWGRRSVTMGGVNFGNSWRTTGYEDMDNAFISSTIRPANWSNSDALARTNVQKTRNRGAQPMYQGYEMIPGTWFLRAPR